MIACPARAAVVVVVLALSACTPQRPPSEVAVPPPVTAVPTKSPTPTKQEFSAQAEKAYRTATQELERLARGGGASEASPLLRSVTAERALVKYEGALRNQQERGLTVRGTGTIHVRPVPGAGLHDYDWRLTLRVCDDRSRVTWTEAGQTHSGYPVQGWAYGRLINNKVMIVDVITERVERCDLS